MKKFTWGYWREGLVMPRHFRCGSGPGRLGFPGPAEPLRPTEPGIYLYRFPGPSSAGLVSKDPSLQTMRD